MKVKKIIPMMLFASMATCGFAQTQLRSGIEMKNLDKSVKPSDDFYEYACGGWMKNNPLPAAYSRFGSFDQLAKDNSERINSILKDLTSKTYTKGTTERKLSDLYKMAMDSVKRNADGVNPVMPTIKELEACKTNADLFAWQLKEASNGCSRIYVYGLQCR